MAQPIMQTCFEPLSISEWEINLKSWKRSRLSKAEYCRRKQISGHAFNYWKKRLEKPKAPSPITLVKFEETKNITSSFNKHR